MNLIQYLFLAILFSAIFIAALLALRLLSPSPIKDRLEALADPLVFKSQASSSYWLNRLISLVAPLAKLSVPEEVGKVRKFAPASSPPAGARHRRRACITPPRRVCSSACR